MDPARRATLEETTRYVPADVEARIFGRWEEAGIFHPEPEGDASENYSIAIPPPNVTGALHMGHALNGSIQDVLIRMKRMQGRRTKWIFGTDHAGIATQVKVEQQLVAEGTSRQEIGREAFLERVWQWREKYGSTIVEQCEVHDTLYLIDYPLESGSGSLTVATVRPETMLADTAIAVNPGDERYTRLIGEAAILPLVGRRLPIIADEYVDPEFGTGALKITPGNEPDLLEIRHMRELD